MDHVKKVGDGYEREKKDEKRRARELKERADALEAECDELDQEIEVSLGTIAFICCRSLQYLF
jgi:hypothetical protein